MFMWLIKTDHVFHFYLQNKCRAYTVQSFFFPLSTFCSTTICFQPWARREDKIEGSLSSQLIIFCFDLRRPSPNHSLRVWTEHKTTKTSPTAPGVTIQYFTEPFTVYFSVAILTPPTGALDHLQYPLYGAHLPSIQKGHFNAKTRGREILNLKSEHPQDAGAFK